MSAQFQQKRLADAISDIYAQVAVLSRVSSIFEEQGSSPPARSATSPTPSAPGRRAASAAELPPARDNDDERMTAIAKLAYKRGEYGYALFED